MWRRTYLALLVIRVYFALSPSYLHPDEVFQGPEVIAGSLFPYPSHRTWEWTSDRPIRSVFPLWLFYGLPMSLLSSVWTNDEGLVEPAAIYYSLRMVMFILSFVLEDWAIYELVHSPRRRKQAVALVASSYVTWTFQTHSFSNSIETLLVLWSIVLIDRIVRAEHRTSVGSCIILGFILVLGVFNRITFPAFILIPGLQLLPHFLHRPSSLTVAFLSLALFTLLAILTDTAFYTGGLATKSFRALYAQVKTTPIVTPYNNILYNAQTSNLAQHGLHPHYQHIVVNLPQLLGPALIVLLHGVTRTTGDKLKAMLKNHRLTSAATGILILSIIPHQEPRFLIPCIPLLLTCLEPPTSENWRQAFWISWAVFNIALSILMGVYHQGGIIPAQIAMPTLVANSFNATNSHEHHVQVFWWKTYPPPTYLLGSSHVDHAGPDSFNISTTPLMGLKQSELQHRLTEYLPACQPSLLDHISETLSLQPPRKAVFLAAPLSAFRFTDKEHSPELHHSPPPISNFTLDFTAPSANDENGDKGGTKFAPFKLEHQALFRNHINLDDMDFGDDGIWPTLSRVVGRRGLGIWRVRRICD